MKDEWKNQAGTLANQNAEQPSIMHAGAWLDIDSTANACISRSARPAYSSILVCIMRPRQQCENQLTSVDFEGLLDVYQLLCIFSLPCDEVESTSTTRLARYGPVLRPPPQLEQEMNEWLG